MGDDSEATIQALEQLYRSRYARFLRLAFVVLGNREGAADAVHEAFVRAIRSRSSVRDGEALEAWVWRTVLNVSLTLRAEARKISERGLAAGNGVDGASEESEWPELRAAVAALPERQRLTLFLRHYADLSYDQIAEVLQVARGTVAATLNQAHTTLRKTIEVRR
jgi:RNA polymerase sigma-70 factor, ECF subfamily